MYIYMYMYVCIYVYVCVYIYIYIYMFVSIVCQMLRLSKTCTWTGDARRSNADCVLVHSRSGVDRSNKRQNS